MAYTTIKKPSDYFNTKLYTGNGYPASNSNNITGVGFQPNLVWLKVRSNADNHCWFDSVRGVQKRLASNLTAVQSNRATALTSFDSDGFTLGDNSESNSENYTYASWNWKAGTTSGIATNGATTITPNSYSFNQTSGMSIINYDGNNTVGAKVAHGLGATPDMMIVKAMNSTAHWAVYHKSMGNTHYLQFDSNAKLDDAGVWNDTSPDNVNFTIGNSDKTNAVTYIAYCFAEKQGYSKFGSYTGNGSTDGNFIYTGFKPAFFLAKRITDGLEPWVMFDNKRANPFNGVTGILKPNLTEAETTQGAGPSMDFLSNGIKFRNTDGTFNNSGIEFIYMAFAEETLVGDNPATAR
jgi:hypothetical protein